MIRKLPHYDLEQALIKWIRMAGDKKIVIDGPIVQQKAVEFAKVMGLMDFTASGGWLHQLKKRENLDFKAI